MADLDEALKKKGGLTLDQLGKYDDICTDTLVDRVYFWSKIRKLDSNARPLRGAPSEDVCNILQKTCIVKKDAIGAQKEILQLQGLVGYMRTLKTTDEKEHFERHLRKYINIYLPDCPFEVCTTNRYTVTTEEACVVARKTIRPGETIKYLSGIQVEMTEQEEKKLSSRTDFSIVLSSRRKRPSLFLGPARFANHDCDSNAKLTTTGPHGIVIVACKNIAVGDEISVSYGNNYFGVDNCECLCTTCERLARNGWDPRGPILHDSSDEEESEEEIEQPARKRQRTAGMTNEERSASKTTASSMNKRKRDAEEDEENEDDDGEQDTSSRPNKRGRPRKILKQPEVIQPVHTTSYAIEVLKLWFRARASQADVDAKIDLEKIMRKASGTLGDFIPEDKKHYGKVNEMLKVLVESNQADVEHAKKRLSSLRTQNAALLGVSEKEAEKYYAPPGHPSYVSLPTPPRDLSDTDGKQSVSDDSDNVVKDESKTRELTPDSISSNGETGHEKNAKITSNKRKRPLTAANRQHAASPLRKVTSVDDQELVQESTKQESPAQSVDVNKISPMETRGRSRRQSAAKNQVRNGNASQRNTSTQGSSPSSIFTGDGTKSASPETSVDDTDRFMTGSISQNIIDMYTSAGPDEGSSNDLVPSRTRTRRQASSTLNEDTVQSIEQPSHHRQRHDDAEDGEERRGEPRNPGDYQLTESLLVDLHDRWVKCRNCDQFFVQHDAYLTRISCSRCERHSKLYGFYWPKTDKAGKDDKDERVLDHRLIHRFIEPDEERNERKGRRTAVDMLKEIDVRNSRDAESRTRSASTEDNRRRSRRFVA